MITFNTPCLKWKIVAAEKLQVGWPGFIAPYLTRYLNKHVVISTSFGGGPETVRTQDFFMDRLGNVTTDPDPVIAEADFLYGEDLPTGEFGATETWTVTETFFQNILVNGGFTTKTEVTLSNPYGLDQLNADLDALIAGVDVASVPWNTLTKNAAADIGSTLTDVNVLIPPEWTYLGYLNGPRTFTTAVPLLAAAYSAFEPGLVSAGDWFANSSVKVVGYISMAGNYCLNTFTLDDELNVLDETCQSGIGACSASSKITPPPVNPETNAYILFTPNCQCGG
jgi:hypothetical protein